MAIKFEATGDFSALIAENEKYQRQVTALTQKLEAAMRAGDEMGAAGQRAFNDLKRFADQATASLAGPADAFREKVGKLDQALAAGLLTKDQYAAAVGQLGEKYLAAAGPVDQYAIRVGQLDRQLSAGKMTQDQYADAIAASKASALQGADGAERYKIELADLDRQLADGKMGQDAYSRKVSDLRQTLLAAASPADQVRLQIQRLDEQLADGSITSQRYDADMKALRDQVNATPDPVDRLQSRLAMLDDQLRRGIVDTREHKKQTQLLREDFLATASPADVYRQAVSELTDQLNDGEITSEDYRKSIAKHDQDLADATGAGEKHGSMVDQLGQKMIALGGGYMSFQAILGTVKEALAYVNQETEKAIGSADKMTDSNKRLIQVYDTAEELDAAVKQADTLAAQFGVQRDVVRRVMFAAKSEGFESAVPDLIKYSDVVDAEAAATVAGQVPGLFGEGSIDAMTAVNATLAAAKSSRLDFEKIATALPKLAEGGALQGADPAEAMGVLSVMAGHFASGDTAADRFKALSTKLSLDERTKGQGIVGGVQTLQAMSDEDRKEFLGDSQELNVAYELLTRRMGDVQERIALVNAEIEAGQTGGQTSLERQYNLMYDQETAFGRQNSALEARRRAQIAEEIANERQFAEGGARREAASDREMARLKEQEVNAAAQSQASWMGRAVGGMLTMLGFDDQVSEAFTAGTTRAIGEVGSGRTRGVEGLTESLREEPLLAPRAAAEMQTQLERIAAATDRTAQSLDRIAASTGTGASAAAAVASPQRQGR